MLSYQQLSRIRNDAERGQSDAQFTMSQVCHQNREYDAMTDWLTRAGSAGHADALDALGHCYEKGLGVARDFDAALDHYQQAMDCGAKFSACHKAELLYKSRQGPSQEGHILKLLVAAAAADFVPAQRALGYLAMQNGNNGSFADDVLARAAHAGDPVSCFNLAWRLLQKDESQSDRQLAAYYLQQAAAANYPCAKSVLATLKDIQSSPPAQRSPSELVSNISLTIYPAPVATDQETISEDPPISVFNAVLDTVDCAYLMFLSGPYLKRADVIDPDTRNSGMVSDVRTNMSAYLPFELVDIISRYIELKIIEGTGHRLSHSEPMSILRYSPGQYYRPHVDYFDPKLNVSKGLLEDGGQRTASAVTYLAAPEAGGGTSFPRLDLTVPAETGSTLWFRNCDDDGQIDKRTVHAGDPVELGEKWVVTKWFREKTTSYLEF